MGMEIELRPLTAGEVLDRTFQFYRARFGMFVGIATVAALIRTAGSAVQVFSVRALQQHAVAHGAAVLLSGTSSLFDLFVSLLAYALSFAAITGAVMALLVGKPTGIALSYQQVWPHWFRYIRLSVVAGFLMAWPFLLVLILFLVQLLLTAHAKPSNPGVAAVRVVVFSLLEFLVAIPICIWLVCRYALCMTACVVEDLKVVASIRRSVRLSKGLRLKIFLLILLVYVIELVFGFAISVPIIGAMMHSHGHLPLTAVIYELAMGFVITFLITPIYGIGLTVIYMDARIRKEGYDIELRMQHAQAHPHTAEPGMPMGDAASHTME